MTTETEPVIEETRIHPGDKYRPDGTFDLDMKVGWAELEIDEETRRVAIRAPRMARNRDSGLQDLTLS